MVFGLLAIGVIAGVVVSVWGPKGPVAASVPAIPADAQLMIVREVLHGDTVVLIADRPGPHVQSWGSVTARLVGVNAPNFGIVPECYAVESEAALTALLPEGSYAWVTTDEIKRDANGRWFVYVWTPDGVLVNEFLAANGFVAPELSPPNDKYWQVIAQTAEQAARQQVGLWAQCQAQESPSAKLSVGACGQCT